MFERIKMCPNKKRHFSSNYSLRNHNCNHNHYHNRNNHHMIHISAISFLLFLLVRHELVLLSEATLLSSSKFKSESESESEFEFESKSKSPKSKLSSLSDFSAVSEVKEQHNPINTNENPSEILLLSPSIDNLDEQQESVSLQRRSSSGGYTANLGGGGRTHVAISLERVKNPDDHPSNSYKKKKFPITWLRNQYPFNTYYNKKNKNKSNYKSVKYGTDPLVGQYSNENIEFLDPNPSSWIKIPDRPTASIKFQKQTDNVANILQSHSSIPPPSLQFNPTNLQMMPDMDLLAHPSMMQSPPFMRLPSYHNNMLPSGNLNRPLMLPAGSTPSGVSSNPRPSVGALMTSESQNDYQPIQPQAPEPQTGFGGISLSFGNGRSISFGGGQGLTIGGRAGAISIGGKGSDNTPAASGYSETTKGGSGGTNGYVSPGASSQAQAQGSSTSGSSSASYGSDGYSNEYVSKHPTMSVDIPRRGKKILHANLDMAPVKVRLHSSPRVKITTGSRDPLEKPSDDEQSENEEDIFEPPEPFPKQNTTSSANETLSNTTTTSSSMFNGTELTTLSPMQLQQQFQQQNTRYYPQEFNQYGYDRQQAQQQQVSFDDYNGNQASRSAYNSNNNIHHNSHNDQHQNNQQHQGYHLQQDLQHFQSPPNQQGYHQAQVPLDEPRLVPHQKQQQLLAPHHPIQQQYESPAYQQQHKVSQQVVQEQLPERVPFNNQASQVPVQPIQPMQPIPPTQMPPSLSNDPPDVPMVNEDQRPAVNHWRQYSRQQMNRFVPKQPDLAGDNIPRLYNGNSIVELRPGAMNQQGPEGRESRDVVDMAASNNDKTYTKTNGFTSIPARFQTHQPHFGPSTAYQIAGQPEIIQGSIKSWAPIQKPIAVNAAPLVKSAPLRNPAQQLKTSAGPTPAPVGQQQQMQPQESNYHSSSAYNSHSTYGGHSKYATHQEAPTRTWTFGNGGISTSYSGGGSSSGYGSGGSYKSGSGYSSGSNPSDGFDQKNYQAKVEKFDPDAHDKRERSKVVVFLKPRISIHSANSSTTTKRPRNQQRLIHVINRPIFLNNTNNRTHHDEEFIDPDLAEPVELGYGYGYGSYGHSYGSGYNSYGSGRRNKTSTTTRKPKTTTTTTTTTFAPDDSTTSSTSSTSETDGTTTTTTTSPSTTLSSDDSSSSSFSPSSSSDSSTTTTSSESPSSSSEPPSPDSSTSTSSTTTETSDSSSTSESPEKFDDSSSSSTAASTTTSTTEASSPDNTSSLPPDVSILDIEGSNGKDSTPDPVDSENTSSVASTSDDSAADLDMSATEPSKVIATTSMPEPTTTTTAAPVKTPSRARASRPSTTTSTSTSTTTTTTTTSTSTAAPPTTTTTPEPPVSSSEAVEAEQPDALSDSPTTTSSPPTTTVSQGESESDEESQSPSKRSARTDAQAQPISSKAQQEQQQQQQQQQRKQQPMLLNAELIDKLMNNKTLVNLMSSQLKRVIDTDKMDELEKRRIVRQVFDQMMEEKVDFSMNNVRLAVKTVSSSYRAAAEKQRQKKSDTSSGSSATKLSKLTKQSRSQESNGNAKSMLSSFGKRGVSSIESTTLGTDQSRSANIKQSKSFPVIDTALKLTKRAQTSASPTFPSPSPSASTSTSALALASQGEGGKIQKKAATNGRDAVKKKKINNQATSAGGKSALGKVDGSGNPIVVVLLPQDKA